MEELVNKLNQDQMQTVQDIRLLAKVWEKAEFIEFRGRQCDSHSLGDVQEMEESPLLEVFHNNEKEF
jgi:hypothetical protein